MADAKKVLERPVVLYDGSCKVCVSSTDQLRGLDKNGVFDWLDANDPVQRARFPKIDWDRAMKEIHLVHVDGRVRTGARAVRDIAEAIGGEVGKAAAKAMDLPGIRDAADLVYAIVSENRHRFGKA